MKLPKVKYVKFTRARGKLYAYFNTGRKVAGKIVFNPLPPYHSVGFWDSYAAMLGARTKRAKVVLDVAALADQYERSDEFKRLSEGTKRLYLFTLKRVTKLMGDAPIDDLQKSDIREALTVIPGAASRNIFVAVIAILYKWARGRDLTDAKPTDGIAKAKTGEHDPWPEELLNAALAADNDLVRLATCLLYNSGQRLGDAVKLRWSDIRGGKIVLTQQKTGKPLLVPISAQLEAELARSPRNGLTIIASATGRPLSSETVRRELKAFASGLGFKIVPHGLRKNAVNSLLLAGCTVPEVQAITGQSAEMVAHYAKKIDQVGMGEAAIIKLDARRKITLA